MIKRKTAIIYESFYDAISDLEDADFVVMMKAYCNYALNGEDPDLKGILLSMWKLIQPIIDKNNQLYENGAKGGRPANQARTKPEPNRNQTKTNANQSTETPKPTPSNDEDVDEDVDVDVDKDVDKDVSLSEKSAQERERVLNLLFFEKKLLSPQKELDRFESHYEKTGWVDANGNPIKNKLAALKAWTPDKDAQKLPTATLKIWQEVYNALEGDRTPLLLHFKGLYLEGPLLSIVVGDKSLVELLELPSCIPILRNVLAKHFGSNLIIRYRIAK